MQVNNLFIMYFELFLFSFSMIRIHGQTCNKMSPYQECARYPGCLCFYKAHSSNTTICALGSLLSCSELVQCKSPNYECSQRDHQCIFHPRCHNYPVCYPIPTYNRRYCLHRSKKKRVKSITLSDMEALLIVHLRVPF